MTALLPIIVSLLLFPVASCLTPEEPTFFSTATLQNDGINFPIHDRPRPRPIRRGDIDPKSGVDSPSLNHVNYGKDGHPYEQVQRYYQQRRLSTEHDYDTKNSSEDDNATGRILQEAQSLFQPLRIHFDTTELDLWSMQSTYTAQRVEYLTKQVLPQMAKAWSSALSVVRVMENLRIDYNSCPFGDPQRSPSFSEQGVPNADLVIYVTANSEVCYRGSSKTLASTFSCFWDQFARPIAGTIDFCLDAIDLTSIDQLSAPTNSGGGGGDVLNPEADKSLQLAVGSAVHELAHVLGVTSADMIFFYDSTTGLRRTLNPQMAEVICIDGQMRELYVPDKSVLQEKVSKQGVRFFEVTLPTVRQVVRNQFNCQTLTGAPLENQPSSEAECFGSHFEERYFFTENLSAVQGGVPEILSSLTLGLLHDSGWYKPDYSVAKVSVFGHGAGCEFVEENCIVNGEVPSYSEGSFCNTEYKIEGNKFLGSYGCDPTHTGMGVCDLVDFSQLSMAYTPPPPEFRYFPGAPSLGALTTRADYCPTYTVNAVTCKQVPGKLEQMKLPILDYFATAAESDSDSSRCFNTDQQRPVCLEAECDAVNHVLNVKVAGRELLCSYDGQTHLIPDTGVTFECPKLAIVCPDMICPANCAGHGVCDYSLTNPTCKCFDRTDRTPGCFESFSSTPPRFVDNGALNRGVTLALAMILPLIVLSVC